MDLCVRRYQIWHLWSSHWTGEEPVGCYSLCLESIQDPASNARSRSFPNLEALLSSLCRLNSRSGNGRKPTQENKLIVCRWLFFLKPGIYLTKFRPCHSNLCHGAFGVGSCRLELDMVGVRKSFLPPRVWPGPWQFVGSLLFRQPLNASTPRKENQECKLTEVLGVSARSTIRITRDEDQKHGLQHVLA